MQRSNQISTKGECFGAAFCGCRIGESIEFSIGLELVCLSARRRRRRRLPPPTPNYEQEKEAIWCLCCVMMDEQRRQVINSRQTSTFVFVRTLRFVNAKPDLFGGQREARRRRLNNLKQSISL